MTNDFAVGVSGAVAEVENVMAAGGDGIECEQVGRGEVDDVT
jgi:hypothetical protein